MAKANDTNAKPVKLYYRIGEAAVVVGVEPSVLRFWETQFRGLRPQRAKSGQRWYSQKDVQKLLDIKKLLHEEGFTTRGALKKLRSAGIEPRDEDDPVVGDNQRLRETLLEIRKDIHQMLMMLDEEPRE